MKTQECHYVGTPLMYLPACIIMIVADALVPNRCQGLNNHHVDSIAVMVSFAIRTVLQPVNKVYSREVGRSVTYQFLCYWRVRLLTTITLMCWLSAAAEGNYVDTGREVLDKHGSWDGREQEINLSNMAVNKLHMVAGMGGGGGHCDTLVML